VYFSLCFNTGTISDVRQLMEDVCFVIQNRNLVSKIVTNTRGRFVDSSGRGLLGSIILNKLTTSLFDIFYIFAEYLRTREN
jgi:hypothetical protein